MLCCSYICIYINAVINSVMLQLYIDLSFYNIIFEKNINIYNPRIIPNSPVKNSGCALAHRFLLLKVINFSLYLSFTVYHGLFLFFFFIFLYLLVPYSFLTPFIYLPFIALSVQLKPMEPITTQYTECRTSDLTVDVYLVASSVKNMFAQPCVSNPLPSFPCPLLL
jgi:hypothetical protein